MKALIVDDQSYVADGIYAGVNWEKLGIDKVYVAYSGSQAMQYIKNNQIDLVITDIEMPVISGVELAAWIVDYRPETAVIFLTAHVIFLMHSRQSGWAVMTILCSRWSIGSWS